LNYRREREAGEVFRRYQSHREGAQRLYAQPFELLRNTKGLDRGITLVDKDRWGERELRGQRNEQIHLGESNLSTHNGPGFFLPRRLYRSAAEPLHRRLHTKDLPNGKQRVLRLPIVLPREFFQWARSVVSTAGSAGQNRYTIVR